MTQTILIPQAVQEKKRFKWTNRPRGHGLLIPAYSNSWIFFVKLNNRNQSNRQARQRTVKTTQQLPLLNFDTQKMALFALLDSLAINKF